MTTIAAGASATITVASGGQVSVSSNGGFWTVVETPVVGSARSALHGPVAHTRVFGPYSLGATLVITNQSVNTFNYVDFEVGMTTLGTIAVGSAQTFTLTDQGNVSVSNPSGYWQVAVTPAIGAATTAVYGPGTGSMTFGPYPVGATVVVMNQTGATLVTSMVTAQSGGGGGVAVAITTQLDAARIIQRTTTTGGGQGKGQASVPMALSFTGTQPIYCQRIASDGTTVLQAAWLANASATTGTVTLSGIDVPAVNSNGVTPTAANDGWFYLSVATSASGPWTLGTTLVTAGRLVAIAGQSLAVRMLNREGDASNTNASLGVTISPLTSVLATFSDSVSYMPTVATMPWAPPADGGNYTSTFVSEFTRRQVGLFGCPAGVIGHSVGGTAITTFINGSPSFANYTQIAAVFARAGGAWEAEIWYQGHAEAAYGCPDIPYGAALTAVHAGFAALNSITAAKYVGSIPNIGSNSAWGTPYQRRRIRKAHNDWATANGAVHVQISDLTQIDSIHQNQIGAIPMAQHFARASKTELSLRGDLGPALVSATRVGTTITAILTDVGQSTLVLTGTPGNRIHVFATGRYDVRTSAAQNRFPVSTVTVTNKTTLSIVLANDPGDGHALDLYFYWANELGITPANDMIRDDITDGDGITVGRQVVPNYASIQIPAPVPASTINAPPSGFISGTSPWNMTATGATYGAQEQTGFGQTMSGGTAIVTAGLGSTPSFTNYTVDCWFTYSGAPGATQVLVGGMGSDYLGINSAGKVLGGGSGVVGTTTLVAGKRYHARLQRGALGSQIYLQNITDATAGAREGTNAAADTNSVISATLAVRNLGGANALTVATLDEVAYFQAVLTTPSASSYTAPTTPYVGNEANLIALYHLDGDTTEAVCW